MQDELRVWLRRRGDEPFTALSLCAGDGRDFLEVLAEQPDLPLTRATLVEWDAGLADAARAAAAGIPAVEVRCADAGLARSLLGAVPADLVLLCGVFGNISDADVRRTIDAAAQLSTAGATVIWTRSRREPDLTPTIRRWFAERDWVETSFHAPPDVQFSVGVHRFVGTPTPMRPGQRLFAFVR